MKVPFFQHSLDEEAYKPVKAVLESNFLTSAGVGKKVEASLCDYFKVDSAFFIFI